MTSRPSDTIDRGAVIAPHGELARFRVAENGETVGVVASTGSSAIVFTALGPDGRFTPPLLVDPGSPEDGAPEIAAGPPGRFAIAWRRGARRVPWSSPSRGRGFL